MRGERHKGGVLTESLTSAEKLKGSTMRRKTKWRRMSGKKKIKTSIFFLLVFSQPPLTIWIYTHKKGFYINFKRSKNRKVLTIQLGLSAKHLALSRRTGREAELPSNKNPQSIEEKSIECGEAQLEINIWIY